MIRIRKSEDRGRGEHGWLSARHTFSFADYRDPAHMHFRAMRVMNEDRVAGGFGFDAHPHNDMEIITYMVSGALRHSDRIGSGHTAILRPGEVQRISAGTGIVHSEHNASGTEPAHLLQIWIFPDRKGHTPRYDQKPFAESERRDALRLVASPDGADGSLAIHQDARIYASLPSAGSTISHALAPGRGAWVQVVRGEIAVNGHTLRPGDGAAVEGEPAVTINAVEDSELLLFDLA
ncbi:MAG: pirin family protein [Phycisphaeraceae bacterium]|nr:pirin family protein [Phycisphaeraceae bacterium]